MRGGVVRHHNISHYELPAPMHHERRMMNIFNIWEHQHCRRCGKAYTKFFGTIYPWTLCPDCGKGWIIDACNAKNAEINKAKVKK